MKNIIWSGLAKQIRAKKKNKSSLQEDKMKYFKICFNIGF